MPIYEILSATTLKKLAKYQRKHHPESPLNTPKQHTVKTYPDDMVEIDRINREMAHGPDHQRKVK